MATALYDAARAFAKKYSKRPPTRSTGTWDQLCGVLMAQFGDYLGDATPGTLNGWKKKPTKSIASAKDVAKNSGKLSKDHLKAPIGAFHFWEIGTYWHVGIDLNGRGQVIFMATTMLKSSWGSAIGVQSAVGYGAKYLGWSTNYSGGTMRLPSEKPALKPTERIVGSGGVHKRQAPASSSRSLAVYAPSSVKDFKGYVKAPAPNGAKIESVGGSSIWFVTGDDYYSHSSGYTSKSTTGLKDLTADLFPQPTPLPVEPEPVPAAPGPAPEPTEPDLPDEPTLPASPEPPEPIDSTPLPPAGEGAPIVRWWALVLGALAAIGAGVLAQILGAP